MKEKFTPQPKLSKEEVLAEYAKTGLDMQYADNIVRIALIDRYPGVSELHKLLKIFASVVIEIEHEHIRTRCHDLICKKVVELEYGVDHLAAFLLDLAGFLSSVEH